MVSELSLRVMVLTLSALLPSVALAAWLGGRRAALGVIAAGVLTIANFFWLVRYVPAAGGWSRERHLVSWALSAAARFAVVAVGVGALLVTGWVHPLALVSGLTVLPCALVAAGLCAGRREPEDR